MNMVKKVVFAFWKETQVWLLESLRRSIFLSIAIGLGLSIGLARGFVQLHEEQAWFSNLYTLENEPISGLPFLWFAFQMCLVMILAGWIFALLMLLFRNVWKIYAELFVDWMRWLKHPNPKIRKLGRVSSAYFMGLLAAFSFIVRPTLVGGFLGGLIIAATTLALTFIYSKHLRIYE